MNLCGISCVSSSKSNAASHGLFSHIDHSKQGLCKSVNTECRFQAKQQCFVLFFSLVFLTFIPTEKIKMWLSPCEHMQKSHVKGLSRLAAV